MKTITLAICSLLFMIFSATTFADEKIIITGNPVVLEQQGNAYSIPNTYTTTTTTSYNYVTVGGDNRVCYLTTQPNLASLNLQVISVNAGNQLVQWYCYLYDDDYFTVNP